ncbi:MAG: efflux RND transporter permease subunit [Leptospiraceae bacterium]|nr:efflux RND transporter permease subunit [Leptospiraceae bacterium]
MTRIAGFLIARPLLTNVLLAVILLFAGASFFNVRRQAYPRVDFGKLNIVTIFPGASPEDVELNVTFKIEEAIREVVGVDHYISRSTENVSFVQVVIDPDVDDQEEVKDQIRSAIDRVSDLPPEIEEQPRIEEIKMDRQPVYEIALTMAEPDDKLLNFHARQLKKKLLDLRSVSVVDEVGMRDREIQIRLSRHRMAEKQISFDDVIRAVKFNRIRVSGGNLESYTAETGIVTLSEFENPADVERIILRSNVTGNHIRIRDVGRVIDDFEKQSYIVKFQGQRGVSLYVQKKWNADVIQSVDAIQAVIAEYKDNLAPKKIQFHSTWDASIETRTMLSLMYGNAIAGLILVVVTLFLFLDYRIAVWTAMGIPLSIAVSLIFIPLLGLTLNSISLMGLIVVLGMIVDDAIIISESIYRFLEEGLSPKDAALKGLANVVRPVFGTIITTIIAFLPMYFVPGIVGDFSREIPTMVIVALSASFLEATTVLPAHIGHARRSSAGPRLQPPGQRLLNALEVVYVRILRLALEHRWLTSAAFAGFLVFGGAIGLLMTNINMFPDDQAYRVWIQGELPQGSNLNYTRRATEKLEAAIQAVPDQMVFAYRTFVGNEYDPATDSVTQLSDRFMTEVILTPATERNRNAHEINNLIKKKLLELDPQHEIQISFFVMSGGPPVGQPIEIEVSGQDNRLRSGLVDTIADELVKMGVADVKTNNRAGKAEIRLLPNYESVSQAQLNVATIASNIRTAFDGTIVTYMQTPDERVPFRVMLDDESTQSVHPLRGLYVSNPMGNQIPLERLVRQTKTVSPVAYYHYNGYRSNKITANIEGNKLSIDTLYKQLKEKYANFEKDYPGFKIDLGGEARESQDFQYQMLISIGVAILTMYLLLVIQFNSFSQPLMVILAIPFGLVGILLAFGLQFMDISMLALIGILGFTGVVVNDSLIMVDFINRLRHGQDAPDTDYPGAPAGKSSLITRDRAAFHDAVIAGARLRLRPIVLTTVTTVVGLVPTAYGLIGGFHHFVSPMVMAMTWGLLVGTSSVLIIIPVFYSLNDSIIIGFRRLQGRLGSP